MICSMQQVLRFAFQKFRILEILNFRPCDAHKGCLDGGNFELLNI